MSDTLAGDESTPDCEELMRKYLLSLEQDKRIARVFTRLEPNDPFLARIDRVDLDTVVLLTYDIDTFEQWGEVVLNIGDLYRIDLWSVEVSRKLFERDLTLDAMKREN